MRVLNFVVFVALIVLTSCNTKVEKAPKEELNAVHQVPIEEIPKAILEKDKVKKRSVVFIAGFDKGNKTYFSDARAYFKSHDVEIVESAFSLQEIILWLNLNKGNSTFAEVHIVAENKMNDNLLETTVKGEKISAKAIKTAIESGKLPKLENVLEKDAKVIVHSAGLGSQIDLIDEFKKVFSSFNDTKIISSKNVSVFGGKFSEYYLAKPYYGFYPTANSPGRVDLSKEFAKNYPDADIDWLSAMNNDSEKFQGDIYSYKFNIPVKWEIEYEENKMPEFRTLKELFAFMKENELISQELNQLSIPIEKYRWFQTVEGDKLVIKGKVTVVCILEPVMSPAYPSEYMKPSIDNLRLYNRL